MANQKDRALAKEALIINELGIHARSAAAIAKIAQAAKSGVRIVKDNESADASSIVDILALMCPQGTTITVTIEDPSEKDILDRIVSLIEDGFGE